MHPAVAAEHGGGAAPAQARRRLPPWRRLLRHPVAVSGLLSAAGAATWLVFFPRVGTDLSAAMARAGWASRYPGAAYIFSWYGGIHPAGYSLLAPYVLAAAGTRAAMAGAAIIAACLLTLLLVRCRAPRPGAAAAWFAVAVCAELTAGRAAFTLALPPALGCMLAVAAARRPYGRVRWPALLAAGGLALLTGALSPVAAVFLGVVAAALAVTGRWPECLAVAIGATLPLGVMSFFSDGGMQPVTPQALLPPLAAACGVLLFIPGRWRLVRAGAVIYAVCVLITWRVPSLLGSNVARLGELLTGPLLAGLGSTRPRWLLAIGLTAAAGWQLAQPIADLAQGNGPAYQPQTAALVRELSALHANTARLEAVPQYGHWESEQLAGTAPLARGWERQVDIERNPLFYRGVLSPAAYHGWLRYNAVRYVAISAARPDLAAVAEAEIVRSGQPWLVPVWHDSFWQLYRVTGTRPLAGPPATVTGSSPAQVTVRMSRPGTAVIRVRWSAFLRATGGGAVTRDGPWTRLTVRRAGTYVLSGPY